MGTTQSSMKSLKAYEIIRDMILTGEKLPGSRLILSDLEKELNIGRGPIREALMRLDRTGLIKNIPYKGAIVETPPTRKEIIHIYDLRIDLEVTLGVEAMGNITDHDILNLEKLHVAMPVDLILLDLALPRGVTGYDVYDCVKADGELANIPVVIVSAADPTIEMPKARDKGLDGYISKPLKYGTFGRTIASILNGQKVWVLD